MAGSKAAKTDRQSADEGYSEQSDALKPVCLGYFFFNEICVLSLSSHDLILENSLHLERGDDHLARALSPVLHAGDGALYEGQHCHDQEQDDRRDAPSAPGICRHTEHPACPCEE
jgi:hypothetical protein